MVEPPWQRELCVVILSYLFQSLLVRIFWKHTQCHGGCMWKWRPKGLRLLFDVFWSVGKLEVEVLFWDSFILLNLFRSLTSLAGSVVSTCRRGCIDRRVEHWARKIMMYNTTDIWKSQLLVSSSSWLGMAFFRCIGFDAKAFEEDKVEFLWAAITVTWMVSHTRHFESGLH